MKDSQKLRAKRKRLSNFETETTEIPTIMIRTTYFSHKTTGVLLDVKHEYQDKEGKWHNL